MSRPLKRIALAASLAVACAASALGQGTQPGKASFESLDKDSDGKVSINEAADNDELFVAFKKLDTDRDGVLTRKEFASFQQARPDA